MILEDLIEDINQQIKNFDDNLESISNQQLDMIETIEELVTRMIIPSANFVDAWIDDKMTELRGIDSIDKWRIVKDSNYNRNIPTWVLPPNNPPQISSVQYTPSSLGRPPDSHLIRFGISSNYSAWSIDEDVNFEDEFLSPLWITRYTYNNVVSDNESDAIQANGEYFYAYDHISQRVTQMDGTYGLVEKINSSTNILNLLIFDKEKLVDTKTFVTSSIVKEEE